MLEQLLHTYLKWTGKRHLSPFLHGLTHLGRPSANLFPLELLEQGLSIVLSGLNNAMAIQSNLDWVWPHWVERQADPEWDEFIPTAINLIKTNLTNRNWTSLGLEDSAQEGMVDPVGMLTLRPYGWSVFPYVRFDGRNYFPPRMFRRGQVHQSLLEGNLPCVVTAYSVHPDLEWKSEALALALGGQELLSYRHLLANRSRTPLSLRFGLTLRPYNPLTIGHINSIRYQDRLWTVNDEPGLWLSEEPDRVTLSDRHHGDPLVRDVQIADRTSLKSGSGIACALAEYDLTLGPGEAKTYDTFGVLAASPAAPSARPPAVWDGARSERLEHLREVREAGLRLRIPDARLEEAFYAVKGHLHVFDDGDHFSPGTFTYHKHWFRDASFIALAFENLGWHRRVTPKLAGYPRLQGGDGFFKSQQGEWDSNGQAMWAMVQHVRRGGDPAWLEKWYPSLLKGAKWIAKMRDRTRDVPSPHYGLLPPGFSAEHFGPNDHYYWDNLWALAGLEALRWAAGRLGRGRDTAWVEDLLQDYRGDIAASMDWAWKKNGGAALPCSPYRAPDSAAIGNLVGISPLAVLPPDPSWLPGTVNYLAANNLRDGLFFHKIVHTGLNPYLSAQLARAMMALGDGRWSAILAALLRRASPTYTWPEAMHPRFFGGCMGDGDHGWSAAEFLNLVRDMLVVERPGALQLAESAPPEWFRPGLHLEVTGARTLHGTVDYSFRQGMLSATLSWNLRRKAHQDEAPLYFSLPRAAGLEPGPSVAAEGNAHRVPLTGDAGTLTFYAATAAEESSPPRNGHVPKSAAETLSPLRRSHV